MRIHVINLDAVLSARPRVVCLCGSTRFYKEFMQANFEETMKGNIVLSVGFFMHAHAEKKEVHGPGVGITPDQKKMLDELHLSKIQLADEVLVINPGGYIGASTKREIWYALFLADTPVRFTDQDKMPTAEVIESWFANEEAWEAAAEAAATVK